MKKTFLTSIAGGFIGALLLVTTLAATFDYRLRLDSSGRIQLDRALLTATNGITVSTNLVAKSFDGIGYWRIVVTNLTGGLGTITNSGSN